jgi:hypothetical protein
MSPLRSDDLTTIIERDGDHRRACSALGTDRTSVR